VGSESRSCSAAVLVDESAEPVAAFQLVDIALTTVEIDGAALVNSAQQVRRLVPESSQQHQVRQTVRNGRESLHSRADLASCAERGAAERGCQSLVAVGVRHGMWEELDHPCSEHAVEYATWSSAL
jgi:hypothetical protein